MVPKADRLDVEVVLVCDPVSDADDELYAFTPEGDRPTHESLNLIHGGLSAVTSQVVVYKNLQEFTDNLKSHADSIVFPYWFGQLSRSRHSLVPAICESYGIVYVGADAYTKIVCNDKYLSKSICRAAGITPAPGFILMCEDDLQNLFDCAYPRVVKPNSQGSSLGIVETSLVGSPETAQVAVRRIAKHFGWPVLCEEFVSGREISICLMGNHRGAPSQQALSWEINGDPNFLDNRLFTYRLKYVGGAKFNPIIIGELEPELRRACERVFGLLDKVEIMRIDGRMTSNGFVALELSPDLDLRPDGEAAQAFQPSLPTYPAFVRQLLVNSLERARS